MRNLECGLWLDETESDAEEMIDELRAMFAVIGERSVAASAEHIATRDSPKEFR